MTFSSLLRIVLILSSSIMNAMSMSYVGLDMREPKKCISLPYPGIELDILYEIFDPAKDRLGAGVRMSDNLSGNILLEVFPPDGSTIARTRENHLIKTLEDTEGVVKYHTNGSGEVHVCVEIKELAGRKYARPTLVGLRLTESSLDDDSSESVKKHEKGQTAAKEHLSEMEKLLNKMIQETSMLLKHADLIKDDEVRFHQKSADMNSASRWWPMMHVVVLLVTGFTQANHIIKFFKSRHII